MVDPKTNPLDARYIKERIESVAKRDAVNQKLRHSARRRTGVAESVAGSGEVGKRETANSKTPSFPRRRESSAAVALG